MGSPAHSARPSNGAKAAVIEPKPLGGTCVNAGCVPKKGIWNGAGLALGLGDAKDYGFRVHADGDHYRTTSSLDQHAGLMARHCPHQFGYHRPRRGPFSRPKTERLTLHQIAD